MKLIFTEQKNFTEQQVQDLFLSVGWVSGQHKGRPGLKTAGNDHFLLPGGTGRLRAPADRPCQREHEPWK